MNADFNPKSVDAQLATIIEKQNSNGDKLDAALSQQVAVNEAHDRRISKLEKWMLGSIGGGIVIVFILHAAIDLIKK